MLYLSVKGIVGLNMCSTKQIMCGWFHKNVVVAPTGVEPVSIASYPLLLSQPPEGVCGLDFLLAMA